MTFADLANGDSLFVDANTFWESLPHSPRPTFCLRSAIV
jgi:hypothetical protein